MKIAFVGQKGIPASFGGVETHVDELSRRLAKRGHEVSAYVRSWYTPRAQREFNQVRLVHTPSVKTKHLDAFVHSFTSSLHGLSQRYDIVHFHAIGPAFFSWMPKLGRSGVVATVHRLDWQAAKWGFAARNFLKLAERSALYLPDATIAVSQDVQRYLENKYQKKIFYIPNGVSVPDVEAPSIISEKYGLRGNDYILFMGRFVPEKRVDLLLGAFQTVTQDRDTGFKLVLAGGSSATDRYSARLIELANGRQDIIFTGFVGGKEKAELLSNARLFVLPSDLEGLPIALLEAMAYGVPCLVSDIPAHREIVVSEANGFLFSTGSLDDLVRGLRALMHGCPAHARQIAEAAKRHVEEHYSWEKLVDQVEDLYRSVR